jgi:hypothetical protein
VSTNVVKWSEGLSNRMTIIIRRYINEMKFAAYRLLSFITLFLILLALFLSYICIYIYLSTAAQLRAFPCFKIMYGISSYEPSSQLLPPLANNTHALIIFRGEQDSARWTVELILKCNKCNISRSQ